MENHLIIWRLANFQRNSSDKGSCKYQYKSGFSWKDLYVSWVFQRSYAKCLQVLQLKYEKDCVQLRCTVDGNYVWRTYKNLMQEYS